MYSHPEDAAQICLEQFPQESHFDTIQIVKDSFIIEEKIDTIYSWFIDHHYLEPEMKIKLKNIIKTMKDTVVITQTKWDDRYKVLYEAKDKAYAVLEDKYNRKRKALFYTWLWIGIIGVGAFAYKKYL
jgi:hypothetical protein